MTSAQSNLALVRSAFEAWIDGRGSFYDLMHPDATWTIPGSVSHCGTMHSREELMTRMVIPFLGCFTRFKATIETIMAEGDIVIVVWSSDATTRDGRPYANRYVYVIEMRDGGASAVTAYLDMVAFNEVWDRLVAA